MALYEGPDGRMELVRAKAGTLLKLGGPRPHELLVLDGSLSIAEKLLLESGDWVRQPASDVLDARADRDAVLLVKRS